MTEEEQEQEEQKLEQEHHRWFQVGKSAGLEEAACRLMEGAKVFFERGIDDKADLLRGHAKHLKARAEEEHPVKDKK